ncbi:MAG: lamin tail domain-containing protein [Treponema sp.]|nr:lamin tail domain-containing protein [Treponema sp.]MCL2251814.1 lamin tail domain-containing protein [Treponema sp.]
MKKNNKIIITAIIAIFFSSLLLTVCDEKDPEINTSQLAGKLLILQAYGSSSTAAGATHSFVELYNTTETAINLNGINLYYADGERGTDVTEDWEWVKISLNKTIPAGGSFLILGPNEGSTAARYKIEEKHGADYGDINDPDFKLSNRSFKVVLIEGSAALNMQNPFDVDGNGKKASGYIDMVGALNNPDASPPDNIFGFETAPARCSASQAVRRKNLSDSNDNSADFIAARYGATSDSGISLTDEEFEVRYPRNSEAGKWNPFAEPEDPPPPDNPTVIGEKSEYAGELLILQAGASTDGAITRSFVELYNNTEADIDLNTFSLQYGTTGTNWTVINLTGTIPAKGSYLITGLLGEITGDSRLYFENADQTVDTFNLNNSGFKVALMENQNKLTVENPFAMTGGTAAKYVDMLGAYNNNASSVDAFETTAFTQISKQAAARRKSLTDNDNNSTDFERIDYRTSGITDTKLAQVRPRYSADGEWSPIPPPPPGTEMLMILQIGAATDGNINRSFIELYNNTNVPINLSGYSVQYAAGFRSGSNTAGSDSAATIDTDGPWHVINLTGTLQPRHSYLILGQAMVSTETNGPALTFADGYGDINMTFNDPHLSNRSIKVVLMSNTTQLTVQNPFIGNSGAPVNGYMDMVGAINTANTDYIQGYEGALIIGLSKQGGQRRANLEDTNNNSADFTRILFATVSAAELERYRPKNQAFGAWDPITGAAIE